MTGLMTDVRYAFRMLFKHPGVSAIAVLALGLGIGLTAVMFSIVYGAIMRGLPFENGDRIVSVHRANPSIGAENMGVSIHDYVDWREQQRGSFTHLAAAYDGTINVRWSDEPERYFGSFLTANTFPALGVEPVVGRAFTEDEDEPGAPATVLLSHRVWMDRFDGDPNALGQVVKVNGEQAEIIGVMPEGFAFPNRSELWVPLRMNPLEIPRNEGTWLTVFGPLAPGVDIDAAMTEMTGIAGRLAAEHPDTNEGVVPVIQPFTERYVGTEATALLYTMLAAVSLVLLIACANVANLLLARSAQRTREVGIRTALGASRWRVVTQLVLEALALSLVATVVGTAIAWVGIDLFDRAVAPTNPPFFMRFALDGPILLFMVAAASASAVIAGGIPALKASGMDVSEVLKDESRGSSSLHIGRLSKVLVVGEIAMSLGLLVGAGLMTKSITTLRDYDYGFDTDDVFTTRLGLFEAEFPDATSRRAFYDELERRVREAPGVRAAALGTLLPGLGSGQTRISVEGVTYSEDRDHPLARSGSVSPGYFETVGVSLIEGRDFTDLDEAGSDPVAIVNRSFASTHFPGEPAVGRRLKPGRSDADASWLTIVGVAPDLFMEGVGNTEGDPEGFYRPIAQSDARFMSVLARGPLEPMTLTEPVRRAVTAVHSDTPVYYSATLAERIDENTWFFNVFGSLFVVFGAAALFLASIGLYGVMSFSVARRTSEVGIRMALGASQKQVLSLILRQGIVQIGVGLVIGLGLALLIARALSTALFEVSPNDPAVFVSIIVLLTVTGVAATLVPAMRATRAEPASALRYE
ncbi:MAG: ABC transporter permease [Gemmatimonadota bacterium]|nr:ABC transporter permease [Gemmatimonadota bacterium]